jgi:hypothetical protein
MIFVKQLSTNSINYLMDDQTCYNFLVNPSFLLRKKSPKNVLEARNVCKMSPKNSFESNNMR